MVSIVYCLWMVSWVMPIRLTQATPTGSGVSLAPHTCASVFLSKPDRHVVGFAFRTSDPDVGASRKARRTWCATGMLVG